MPVSPGSKLLVTACAFQDLLELDQSHRASRHDQDPAAQIAESDTSGPCLPILGQGSAAVDSVLSSVVRSGLSAAGELAPEAPQQAVKGTRGTAASAMELAGAELSEVNAVSEPDSQVRQETVISGTDIQAGLDSALEQGLSQASIKTTSENSKALDGSEEHCKMEACEMRKNGYQVCDWPAGSLKPSNGSDCGGDGGCLGEGGVGNENSKARVNGQENSWKQDATTETPPTGVRKRRRSQSDPDFIPDIAGASAAGTVAREGLSFAIKLEKLNSEQQPLGGSSGGMFGARTLGYGGTASSEGAGAVETDIITKGSADNPICL